MIGMVAALVLGQPLVRDCERWGGEELRACEIERTENDILDAAESVPAHLMGEGSIRFSSMPALGGDAYVVELRPNSRGGARVRFTWLNGHPRWRWFTEARWAFDLSPAAFREFTESVEGAMSRIEPDPGPLDPDQPEERIFCTDGPGFLTERVSDGTVFTMTGSCPYRWGEEHPHREVEAKILDMICPRFRTEFNPNDGIGDDCVRRDRRIRSSRR